MLPELKNLKNEFMQINRSNKPNNSIYLAIIAVLLFVFFIFADIFNETLLSLLSIYLGPLSQSIYLGVFGFVILFGLITLALAMGNVHESMKDVARTDSEALNIYKKIESGVKKEYNNQFLSFTPSIRFEINNRDNNNVLDKLRKIFEEMGFSKIETDYKKKRVTAKKKQNREFGEYLLVEAETEETEANSVNLIINCTTFSRVGGLRGRYFPSCPSISFIVKKEIQEKIHSEFTIISESESE
ncbi:MAG: hypothetical protein ABIA76_04405 [Candidatus Diapherotrites archaeon]